MTLVALGLGSNKTFSNLRCEQILACAVAALSKILVGVKMSSVYRTKAMYVTEQADFYNMVVTGFVDDNTTAHELLDEIHKIEAAFGRDRDKEIRFGPRSLDIDIEFFGTQKILMNDLEIPHPRLKERAFVLIPLLEVLEKSSDDINAKVFCLSFDELNSCVVDLGNSSDEVEKCDVLSSAIFTA